MCPIFEVSLITWAPAVQCINGYFMQRDSLGSVPNWDGEKNELYFGKYV